MDRRKKFATLNVAQKKIQKEREKTPDMLNWSDRKSETRMMNDKINKMNEMLFFACVVGIFAVAVAAALEPEASITMLEYMMISMISFINDSSRVSVWLRMH